MPVKIIQADLSDDVHNNAIIELLNSYALDPMGGGSALSEYVQQNLIPALRQRPGIYVILAFVDGRPAGLMNCIEGFSTFQCKPLLNIHDVVVNAGFRGRGLATKMFSLAEEIARSLGCCKMTLEVLEGNSIARAAYEKVGFSGYELDPKMGKALFWEKKLS